MKKSTRLLHVFNVSLNIQLGIGFRPARWIHLRRAHIYLNIARSLWIFLVNWLMKVLGRPERYMFKTIFRDHLILELTTITLQFHTRPGKTRHPIRNAILRNTTGNTTNFILSTFSTLKNSYRKPCFSTKAHQFI